jgi:hypothetical protein
VSGRPVIERLGILVVVFGLAAMFGLLAAAAWSNGESFLGVMAGLGALMTAWAGLAGARRG